MTPINDVAGKTWLYDWGISIFTWVFSLTVHGSERENCIIISEIDGLLFILCQIIGQTSGYMSSYFKHAPERKLGKCIFIWWAFRLKFASGNQQQNPQTPCFRRQPLISGFCIRLCRNIYILFWIIENKTRTLIISHLYTFKINVHIFGQSKPITKFSQPGILFSCSSPYHVLSFPHWPGNTDQGMSDIFTIYFLVTSQQDTIAPCDVMGDCSMHCRKRHLQVTISRIPFLLETFIGMVFRLPSYFLNARCIQYRSIHHLNPKCINGLSEVKPVDYSLRNRVKLV